MTDCENKYFFSLLIKALEIKRKFRLYTSEKDYAKAGNKRLKVNKCLDTKFSGSFNSVINSPRKVKPGFFNRFLVEDSVENFILKSVFGFLGGILLTYICFMFLVFSLNFTLKRATYICVGLGIVLSLGLAFSVKIRCTVFLCIPQLFSKRGRQALLAYAFILALSGPAKNTLHNVEVMSESLACTQEQLKQAENELLKCVQKPNAAAKKTIEKLVEKINSAVKDFKHFILQLYKNCFDILETILHTQKWLYSITSLCHKKMGKPAHRCLKLLAERRENCESILPFLTWKKLCTVDPDFETELCSVDARFVCLRKDVPEHLPVLKLQKQLLNFKHRAMNILYVSIEAHQTYSQSNRSYTYHEEYQGMATEIRQKTDQFLQYFDFMSVIFGIFILVLFVKVIIYRHKFLTEDHYDNRFITSDFVDIDNTRAAFQMETLLPLVPREKMKYIKVTSVRLVPCERVRLVSSFVFLIFATFKIIIHMLTDSSLYWILSNVRRDERLLYMSTLKEEEPVVTVRVEGDGLVADLFRNVSRAVKRESAMVRLDPTPCLPDPVPPDWNRYYQILALVIICWLLALCEPYGLRLRHTVMVTYHPDRARERAIWLYNRIISNRISFVKISRRELRRKYKDVLLEETFRYKFMSKASPRCLLCETTINSIDNSVKCTTAKCIGLYCSTCFESLKFCSICHDPSEYGDLSDLSEEKDSSEEERPNRSPRKRIDKQRRREGKGSITLNLKKTNIKLKESPRSQATNKSVSELFQPTLFYRALKYCRSKMPSFRKLRTLSDFESSDWDHDSTLTSSVTDSEDGSGRRSKKSKSMKSSVRKREKQEIDSPGEKRSLIDSSRVRPKVCIFQKVPPETSDRKTPENSVEMEQKSPPDFYFTPNVKEEKRKPLEQVRDSKELLLLKEKRKSESSSFKKRNSGMFVNDEMLEEKVSEVIYPEEYDPEILPPLCPINRLERKYSSSSRRSPRILPFIDPMNIHQFGLGTDSDEESWFDKCSSAGSMREKVKPEFQVARHDSRSCLKGDESSDSLSENMRFCSKEEPVSFSSEGDSKFYNQPYRGSDTFLQPAKMSSDVKRASADSSRCSCYYSVDTDSSNSSVQAVASVRPSRKLRKIQTKIQKQTNKPEEEEQSDIILKLLASTLEKLSNKVGFWREKLVEFIKQSFKERKSSEDERSSDVDDVEYLPKAAVFLPDEEYQRISREITCSEKKQTTS